MPRRLLLACIYTCRAFGLTSIELTSFKNTTATVIQYVRDELLACCRCDVTTIDRNIRKSIFGLHLWQPRPQRQLRRQQQQQQCQLLCIADEAPTVHLSPVVHSPPVDHDSTVVCGSTVNGSTVAHGSLITLDSYVVRAPLVVHGSPVVYGLSVAHGSTIVQ